MRLASAMAEGHTHRSLGYHPRNVMRISIFWPKAIFTETVTLVNLAFGQ